MENKLVFLQIFFTFNCILFISIIVCFFFVYSTQSNNQNDLLNQRNYQQIQYSQYFDYVFPFVNLEDMNFKGKCGTIFNQQNATERDLFLFSYDVGSQWRQQKKDIIFSLALLRKTLPNISLVVLSKGTLTKDFIYVCETFNVTIEQSSNYLKYKNWQTVNARIPMALEYLKKHQKDYDRVAWSDLRDIYVVNDIFATVGMDELYWMAECRSESLCNDHTSKIYSLHYRWMLWFFGKKEADMLATMDSVVVNGGFGIGGINKMIQFLTIWNDNIRLKYVNVWAYDQTLLNYLYYNDYFKDINVIINQCNQRMCFGPHLSINYDNKTFILNNTECAPVLIHKDFPERMKKYFVV